jgi:hypothetical protein
MAASRPVFVTVDSSSAPFPGRCCFFRRITGLEDDRGAGFFVDELWNSISLHSPRLKSWAFFLSIVGVITNKKWEKLHDLLLFKTDNG